MKKLTIEHLSAYFPHRLRLIDGNEDVSELVELSTNNQPIVVHSEAYGIGRYKLDGFAKPILRPLSDITNEITHNGETFYPLHELGDALNDENMGYPDHYIDYINPENSGKDIEWLSEPWFIVQQLLAWHFDVFGLIEAGLAIDINTLSQ